MISIWLDDIRVRSLGERWVDDNDAIGFGSILRAGCLHTGGTPSHTQYIFT